MNEAQQNTKDTPCPELRVQLAASPLSGLLSELRHRADMLEKEAAAIRCLAVDLAAAQADAQRRGVQAPLSPQGIMALWRLQKS